jgi:hypothetical protein
MSERWWIHVSGPRLAQGDVIPECRLPVFAGEVGKTTEESVHQATLIIITQSCDLENAKVTFVALCPIHSLSDFENANPDFRRRVGWEQVRKGRVEGLHLLASPISPEDNESAFVVDFGHIVSVPLSYLAKHAESLESRLRLASPFLEHFSQSFARFFMRVGLPSSIPPYSEKRK